MGEREKSSRNCYGGKVARVVIHLTLYHHSKFQENQSSPWIHPGQGQLDQ